MCAREKTAAENETQAGKQQTKFEPEEVLLLLLMLMMLLTSHHPRSVSHTQTRETNGLERGHTHREAKEQNGWGDRRKAGRVRKRRRENEEREKR